MNVTLRRGSPGTGEARPPLAAAPNYLFIEITTACNLRCKQCHMWMSREPAGTLTTEEKLALVDEFAEWAGKGVVVMTGGETFMKADEVLALSRRARQRGLSTAVNTNGTYLRGLNYDALLDEGPRYLVISLDAPTAEVHDWIRGQPGTFDQVVGVIRELVAHRRARGRPTDVKILVNAILCKATLPLVREHIEFVRSLGVDGVMFQALGRTFMNQGHGDSFFDRQRPDDPALVASILDDLIALRERDGFLNTEVRDLRWMGSYFDDPDFTAEPVCGSADRNVMVNMFGEVQLCFGMKGLTGGRALGDVRTSSLRELWTGEQAARARGIMDHCRKNCGMLHCHRREGSA